MKSIKHRLLSLLLTLVTVLSLLPTAAFAASNTGSGLKITTNQAYWSTRLLANGTPYSYRPPLVDGKLVYCMDSGLGYRRLQKHPSVELIEEIQGTNAHYEGDNDLTKCILKLPARYREMILLRYHHGYTVREIAKVLGLSLPTAIKLDQRAKSRLKKMCEEEGIL